MGYSDVSVLQRCKKREFATPADFPRRECSPYQGLHARRERFGFVHRLRIDFCRRVPNPNVTIRNFVSAVCALMEPTFSSRLSHLSLPPA
jgi:hypothetical protein